MSGKNKKPSPPGVKTVKHRCIVERINIYAPSQFAAWAFSQVLPTENWRNIRARIDVENAMLHVEAERDLPNITN